MHLDDLARRDDLRAEVRAFLADEIGGGGFIPRCDSWLTGWDASFSRRLAARGWVGMTLPRAYGGQDADPLDRLVVAEELLAAGAPVAAHWFAERQTGPAILRHGTAEQREYWLPRIAAAEAFFAVGLSEPESGSDLASVRTRANKVAGGWRLTGTKIWTSGAHEAHAIVVLARSTPGSQGSTGLSQFLITLPHPSVTIRPIRSIDDGHHFNEVHLDGALVADTDVLGTPGAGWEQVITELAFERSGPERFLSTMPLLELLRAVATDPAVAAQPVGSLAASLAALREMSAGVAAELAAGRAPVVTAALVKDLGTTIEQQSVDLARAAAPAVPSRHLPRYLSMLNAATVQSPNFTIRGGTSEILRGIVARELRAGPAAHRQDADVETDGGASLVRQAVDQILGRAPAPAAGELDPAWTGLAEAELPWVAVPEAAGGAGGGVEELAAVLSAIATRGRSLPVVETAFVGGWLAQRAGWQVGRDLALPVVSPRADGAYARPAGQGWLVGGYFPAIGWARHADSYLLVLPAPEGRWVACRVAASAATVVEGCNAAGDPVDSVELREVRVPDVADIGEDGFDLALCQAALGRALQLSAAMTAVLRLTVRYAGERHQFGRPIGAFQAVSQRIARMAEQEASARAAVRVALRARSPLACAAAKARASSAAIQLAADAHQVHGAMGVSAEYPLGRLTKRLWSWTGEYGDEGYWNQVLGTAVLAGPTGLWESVVELGRPQGASTRRADGALLEDIWQPH